MNALEQFLSVAGRIVYCTMATVDRRGRPRSRVVHPVWRLEDGELRGLIGCRPTALKRAHLTLAPFVSCSYWDQQHDVAVAECAARWIEDAEGRRAAWRDLAEGYDPATIFPGGPDDPGFAPLALEPWRVSAASAASIAAGEPRLVWARLAGHAHVA